MRVSYENIRVRLGGREIVKGISLSSVEGRITGIIGPNGCGKSTLIKTTFGICAPWAGTVFLDGQDAAKISPRKLASLVGYVGQDTECVFDFSVADVVAMAMYARREPAKRTREVVEQALLELGILPLKNRSILSLSGGERKLVFIARAAALGADVIILDEPTNHLDIRHQLFLLDYLKQSGKTVLIVLHDLRLAAHYCDYLYVLSEGRVRVSGEPMEVLTPELVREVFQIPGRAYVNQAGERDFELFA